MPKVLIPGQSGDEKRCVLWGRCAKASLCYDPCLLCVNWAEGPHRALWWACKSRDSWTSRLSLGLSAHPVGHLMFCLTVHHRAFCHWPSAAAALHLFLFCFCIPFAGVESLWCNFTFSRHLAAKSVCKETWRYKIKKIWINKNTQMFSKLLCCI